MNSSDDTDDTDLPVLQLLGLARTPRGWCVVAVTTQGTAVIDTEILHGPDTKASCGQQLLREAEQLIGPNRRQAARGLN